MKALFAGSFNPFTIGHKDIVIRALPLFDKIIIGIGCNVDKKNQYETENTLQNISNIFKNEPRVEVKIYKNLTTDFAKEQQADVILRAVRGTKDFEYEQNMAEINRQISGIETLLMFASPAYAHISSSMVRELMNYNKDISEFVPNREP